MAMTWSTLEAAFDGNDNAAAVLGALTSASMAELQESLDAIGAGEAGPLLAAEATADHEKLVAALEIIDRGLAADESDSGDAARVEVVAALVSAASGADSEQLRRRAALALAASQAHLAAARDGDKNVRKEESRASGAVMEKMLRVLLNEMTPAPRQARLRFGRRGGRS